MGTSICCRCSPKKQKKKQKKNPKKNKVSLKYINKNGQGCGRHFCHRVRDKRHKALTDTRTASPHNTDHACLGKKQVANPSRVRPCFGENHHLYNMCYACVCVYTHRRHEKHSGQWPVCWAQGGRFHPLLLHFQNNKNAIKIKEKLVSISDFLFTLKIQRVFLLKRYLKEKVPPAEIKTHIER